jgi:hypothetical protein
VAGLQVTRVVLCLPLKQLWSQLLQDKHPLPARMCGVSQYLQFLPQQLTCGTPSSSLLPSPLCHMVTKDENSGMSHRLGEYGIPVCSLALSSAWGEQVQGSCLHRCQSFVPPQSLLPSPTAPGLPWPWSKLLRPSGIWLLLSD